MIYFSNDEECRPILDNAITEGFFFWIFIAAGLLVGNDENTKFLFCRKSFKLMELRCNQS